MYCEHPDKLLTLKACKSCLKSSGQLLDLPYYPGYFIKVPGLSHHYVNELGHVYSTHKKAICVFGSPSSGYRRIKANRRMYYVHTLIANAWLSDWQFPGCVVDHIDRDKLNNNLTNLHIVTPRTNHMNRPRRGCISYEPYDTKAGKQNYYMFCWCVDRVKRSRGFNTRQEAEQFRDEMLNHINFLPDYPKYQEMTFNAEPSV